VRHTRIWLTSLLVLGTLARAGVAAPAISIDPIPIVFYAPPDLWAIGAPPGVKQGGWFNVRNTGDAPLVVTGMAIAGADAGIMSFDGELDPARSRSSVRPRSRWDRRRPGG
jgi:hypothetical protein